MRHATSGFSKYPTPAVAVTSHPAHGARPRPRAVFTSNEQQALGCLSALAEHGLRAPDDLALICFNGTQQSEFSVPPLSAVEQPIDAMAKRAIAMMAAGAAPAELHEFAFQLRIRHSCGC